MTQEGLQSFPLLPLVVCLFTLIRGQYEPYGENVALSKHATQSTTFQDYSASLGVDGNTATDFDKKTCSHTNNTGAITEAWWIVYLGEFYFIKFITIFQPTNLNRLDGATMYIKGEDGTRHEIQLTAHWLFTEFNVSVLLDKRIDEIKLYNKKPPLDPTFISVCELQAYKVLECSPYTFANGCIEVETLGEKNQTFTYGAKLNLSCNEGYEISEKGMITNETKSIVECKATKSWSRNLSCSVIDCGQPINIPDNSTVISSTGLAGNTSYNATMRIICDKGFNYTLPGNDTIKCADEGKWIGILEHCKESKPPDWTAVIVGSVVTSVIVVSLVVGIIIFMRRRNEHKDSATQSVNEIDEIDEIRMGGSSNPVEMDCQSGPSNKSKKGRGSYSTKPTSSATKRNVDEDSYENMQSIRKKDIKVEDLFDFVLQRRSKSNLYEEEYKQSAISVIKSKDVAMQAENKNKYRYKGMLPYDDNRVKLHVWDADMETDYINASYIDGFSGRQAYVAAQGPMENTLNDFWRMIWQLKTKKIVMLTNLTEGSGRKCMQYWPDEGEVNFGKINVHLVQTDQFSDFTIRTMKIKMNNDLKDEKSRIIKQFHFTTWPDKSVPRYCSSIVHFRHKIHTTEVEEKCNGPLVVHCSAGVGRTGTFIAIDYLVDQAEAQGNVNVTSCLESLRNQRVLMIQTLDQFIFVHEVLVEALTCTTSAVSTRDFHEEYRKLLTREPKQKRTFLELAFEKLQNLNPETDENTYAIAKESGNRDKNRYCNILPATKAREPVKHHAELPNSIRMIIIGPSGSGKTQLLLNLIMRWMKWDKLYLVAPSVDDQRCYEVLKDFNENASEIKDENYRPYLSTHVSGRNSYINAVFLPAYKENDAFIITQTPLENTIVDFWRMVYQYDVSSIVMLNSPSQMKDNERYWPQKGNVFKCPPFEIHLESEETIGCCEISKLVLIYKEEQRNVLLSIANYWTEDGRLPNSPLHVLEHVELVHCWQTESAGRNPVVVHCMNGADRSGLFCVIAAVLERTKIEQDVAIEQIVRQLRHRRSQIIPDLEQFRFCHEAVLAYLNQNETYANF